MRLKDIKVVHELLSLPVQWHTEGNQNNNEIPTWPTRDCVNILKDLVEKADSAHE